VLLRDRPGGDGGSGLAQGVNWRSRREGGGHSDPCRMGFFAGTYRNVRLADDDGHTEGRNIYGSPDEGPMVRILLPPAGSLERT
jgi:hypothetical protein